MPIRSLRDKGTSDIAQEIHSRIARRKLPDFLHEVAYRKRVFLDNVHSLEDLASWKGLRLEKLKGARKNQFSIRINDQYRICFNWNGVDAIDVEVVDYH